MTAENTVADMPALDTVTTSIDAESSQGFLQKTFSGFSFDSMLEKMHLTRESLLEIALCFGGGFVLGFLMKKYSNYFFALTFFVIGLWIANYFNIISLTINMDTITSLFGYPPLPADTSLVSHFVSVIQERVRATISFVSGFVVGIWVN